MKFFIAFVLASTFICSASFAQANTVYERVIKSGTLKCGYIPYPPALIIDPNTGEKSGIFYEFMNEVAKRLSLKVEWVQETGWGTFINDLRTDRFDAVCSAIWVNAARAREADHTKPLYYSGIGAWVRADDDRFNNDLSLLNHKDFTIATIDGEAASIIAKSDFPKATLFSLPELSSVSDMALSVSTGKADITFLENYIAQGFLKSNPNTLQRVKGDIRVYGNSVHIKKGEHDLRLMLNSAIEEVANSSLVEDLFIKYDVPAGSYFMPAKPYKGR